MATGAPPEYLLILLELLVINRVVIFINSEYRSIVLTYGLSSMGILQDLLSVRSSGTHEEASLIDVTWVHSCWWSGPGWCWRAEWLMRADAVQDSVQISQISSIA